MRRREFLGKTGGAIAAIPMAAAPFLQATPQIGTRPAIKITDIKTFLVGLGDRNLVFVKVETDQGIHGIGEAYSCGPDEATVATITDFKRWLVGRNPRNIEHLWATMYNFTRFPGRPGRQRRHQRHRACALGHCRQGGRPAGLHASGWQVPREDPRVSERGRRTSPEQVADDAKRSGREIRLHGGEDVAPPARWQCPAVQPGHAHGGPASGRRSRSPGSRRRHRSGYSCQVFRGLARHPAG